MGSCGCGTLNCRGEAEEGLSAADGPSGSSIRQRLGTGTSSHVARWPHCVECGDMQRGMGAGRGARSRPSTQLIWALAVLLWLACLLEMLKARKQTTSASRVHAPLYAEEPHYSSNKWEDKHTRLESGTETERERVGPQFGSQLQSSTPSLPPPGPAPPPPPRLTAFTRASAVDPSRFMVTALHPDLAEQLQPIHRSATAASSVISNPADDASPYSTSLPAAAHNTHTAEALRSCVAVAAAVAGAGAGGAGATRGRALTPAVQYAAAGAGGFNGTWVYRNGAADNSHYSHMAMVERLPPGSRHAFLAVWQAADQVAGGSDMHLRATMSDDLLSWLPTWKLPLPQVGALWAPVLFHLPPRAARRGSGISAPLLLLYTESSSCIRERPKLGDQAYAPGGDIKMVTSTDGLAWSHPHTVWSQAAEGGVPKVIANRPIALNDGVILLPFWREDPKPISRRCHLSASCASCIVKSSAPVGVSGTLLSRDGGGSWVLGGDIRPPRSAKPILLLEGTVVQLAASHVVLQLFRTNAGFIYAARSKDGGLKWTEARALPALPNPGSKVSMLQLWPGLLALGYNHHGPGNVDGQKVSSRTRLRVALSADDGATWSTVAKLEEVVAPLTKFHYPTLLPGPSAAAAEGACELGVLYTVGFKERASDGGVRAAVLDLSAIAAQRKERERESGTMFKPGGGRALVG